MEDHKEIVDLMIILMKSTGKYTHRHIEGDHRKEAYRKAMAKCVYIIYNRMNLSLWRSREQVESVSITDSNTHYPKSFWKSYKEERRYAKLAVDHALEIIDRLEARFITGGHDPEPRAYRNRGQVLLEEENLFETYRD